MTMQELQHSNALRNLVPFVQFKQSEKRAFSLQLY